MPKQKIEVQYFDLAFLLIACGKKLLHIRRNKSFFTFIFTQDRETEKLIEEFEYRGTIDVFYSDALEAKEYLFHRIDLLISNEEDQIRCNENEYL
jgi:hypothetical protein